MTINQLVEQFQKEKQEGVTSRFPCRAIMVKNIEEYCQLISELKKINDIKMVQTSELFSNVDVLPKYENLKAEKYHDEWLILTGVSEYLRLFSKKEAVDRRFATLWSYQAPASSKGRIIIPLCGCEAQWFDSSLNLNGDLRQNDFYFDCSSDSSKECEMNLLILSGKFDTFINKMSALQGELKIGLQDWFEYWMAPDVSKKDFVLLTKRCNGILNTNGNVSIHVILDTLSFVKENMAGTEILNYDNCSDEMQNILFEYALKGYSLDDSILDLLNLHSFSGIDVMKKWNNIEESHKRFAKIWVDYHPDTSYVCHCFKKAKSITDINTVIALDIFYVYAEKPEWIKEYREIMMSGAIEPDDRFFDAINSIPEYETRLNFLCGKTSRERIYLLNMIGKWMRIDFEQVSKCDLLKATYPELHFYLSEQPQITGEELTGYLSRYKSYKLENTLPSDEELYFGNVSSENFDNRYSVLSEMIEDDTVVLWIDALGVEWLSLLCKSIESNCDAKIKRVEVVQSILPTETKYNELWKQMNVPYEKLDKLDKLAHKGVIDDPDYYACVFEQFAFVYGINKKISELMKKYHRVIITGDHGTSRLAARFFHNRDGLDVPKGSTVYSHGRYCITDSVKDLKYPKVIFKTNGDGNSFGIFSNYDHFTQSGFAAGADDENAIYGEVHGGATPEEMLVPLIVVDSNNEVALSATWESDSAKIRMKKATLKIMFNRPIKNLQVKIANIDGLVSPESDGKEWKVIIPGIKEGKYQAQVYANNTIITLPDVTIKPAMEGNDLPW